MNHLAPVYFNDVNDNLNPNSHECLSHIVPFDHFEKDLAAHQIPRYNLIVPNLCHQGHEGIQSCAPNEAADNTLRSDEWLKEHVHVILDSKEYKDGGALFILWDEAEDTGKYSDGPVSFFLLSPFAKGEGKKAYINKIAYDHSSTLKTIEEIFQVTPLLGGAADPKTKDLKDLFK